MTVYVDGVFDLFHTGHVNLLRRAKEIASMKGCVLTVGVVGDSAAVTYKRQPLLTLEERWPVVAACKYVDRTIPDCPLVLTEDFIDREGIVMVIHGDDSAQSDFFAAAILRGIMQYLPYTPGISTTDLLLRAGRYGLAASEKRGPSKEADDPDERLDYY